MKNHHSVSNFCKRFTTFAILAGSLAFSTPAFSDSPSCATLSIEAQKALHSYLALYEVCLMFPDAKCIKKVEIRHQIYEDTIAAARACKE